MKNVIIFDIEACTWNFKADKGFLLCVGYKYLGDTKTTVLQRKFPVKDVFDDKELCQRVYDVLADDSVEAYIGHNLKWFDIPFFNTRLLLNGLPPLPQTRVFDTCNTMYKKLRMGNSLKNAIFQFKLPAEKTALDLPGSLRAAMGDKKEMALIVDHCLAPHHKVLTESLEWRKLADIKVGDRLVGFDETTENGPRTYQPSIVESIQYKMAPTYRVELSNGQVFITTGNHQWLQGRRGGGGWIQTSSLQDARYGKHASKVPVLFPYFQEEKTHDAGWLAGFLDGEGSVDKRLGVTAGQRPGAVLDKAVGLLEARGEEYKLRLTAEPQPGGLGKGDCMSLRLNGNLGARVAFMGAIRPTRLIQKVDISSWGRLERRGETVSVVSVQENGVAEIAVMQTSTRTFISEGIPMHNCKKDVEATEELYKRLIPLGQNGWHVGALKGLPEACKNCGTDGQFQRRGWNIAVKTRSPRFQCQKCGGWDSGKPVKI